MNITKNSKRIANIIALLVVILCIIGLSHDSNIPSNKSLSTNQPIFNITQSQNDISSAKVTCYLHQKTTQIQLDITFVGGESLSKANEKDLFTKSVNEEIEIKGRIRNVVVIEDGYNELDFIISETSNITSLQFELSSAIPIGFTRNVKVNYIQDTIDFQTHYNYILGVSWLRKIGNQNVNIIFDQGLTLLESLPLPHKISSVNNQLILSWLEVNKNEFQTSINYTKMITIENLEVTPEKLELGRISKSSNEFTKIIRLSNNENQALSGTIVCPDGINSNVSTWSLNIGESLNIELTFEPKMISDLDCNITINFNIAAYPLIIEVQGKMTTLSNINIIILASSILGLVIIISGFFITKRFRKSKDNLQIDDIHSEEMIIQQIDRKKWTEILTEKESIIFNLILDNSTQTQADLCRLSGLSKSTVSRAVGRLVTKGLLLKEKYGMSNKIKLNTKFFSNGTKND